MRILVLVPRAYAHRLTAPLAALGHDVVAVATDVHREPPPVPEGVRGHTRGLLRTVWQAHAPEAVLYLVDDPAAVDAASTVDTTGRWARPEPEYHALSSVAAEDFTVARMLGDLFPAPRAPQESGDDGGVPAVAETPRKRRTRAPKTSG